MEYVYGAMLLHSAGQEIDEANLKKVMTASNIKPDSARIKALVASLDGVDIEDAIKTAAPVAAAAPAAPAAEEAKAEESKEKKNEEDDKKTEEEAASGLASLFG